jgi:hypothetical protein
MGLSVYARKYTGIETTTVTTQTGSSNTAVMLAYRGTTGIEPVVSAIEVTGTSASTPITTTTVANELIISVYAITSATNTITPDPATTQRINSIISLRPGLLIADEIKSTAGASTPRTATFANSTTCRAVSIAFYEPVQTYYWVGGSGTWNTSSTTNWSLDSGGSSGVGPPTLKDNVIFDNNSSGGSAFTVTASGAVCNDLVFGTGATALTNAITLNGTLTVAGDFYLPLTNYSSASSATITFNSSFTGRVFNAPPTNLHNLTINGIGGPQLQADWNNNACVLTVTQGYIEFNNRTSNFSTITYGSGAGLKGTNARDGGLVNLYGNGNVWTSNTTASSSFFSNGSTLNIIGSATGGNRTANISGVFGTIHNQLTVLSFFIINGSATINLLKNTGTTGRWFGFLRTVNPTINSFEINSGPGNVTRLIGQGPPTFSTINYPGPRLNLDYVEITALTFSYTLDNTNPFLVYAGANSTNGSFVSGVAFIDGTQFTAYRLTSSGNFTIPANWNSLNNIIYLTGAGGGGGQGRLSGTNRAAGGGGGGGGFTVVTNFSATVGQVIPFVIGAGGASRSEATGGSTTWNSGAFIATGGTGGSSDATIPISIAGVGGTGTYTGGNGGLGFVNTTSANAGGGGAGSPAGLLGNGKNGGNGLDANGGGGAGCAGGTDGGNATSIAGGVGGNNQNGIGGGASATVGTVGGGGGGGVNTTSNGTGSEGTGNINTYGSGSNGGGGAGGSQIGSSAFRGNGGGGIGINTAGTLHGGGINSPGVIFVIYSTAPPPPPPPSAPIILSGVTIEGGVTFV